MPGDLRTPVQRHSLRNRADCLLRLPELMAHVLHWPSLLKHKCSLGFVSRPSVREHGLHNGVIRGRYAQISRRTRARNARTKQSNSKQKPNEQSNGMRIINKQSRKSNQGFTLIEMIGVLAVIAILASMLIPKIFEAINSARINNTVQSYNAVKTAVMDHYGKYGSINFLGVPAPGAAATAAQLAAYDRLILLPEALIDKPFAARVGVTWIVQAVAGAAAGTTVDGVNSAYDLDGSGPAATPANDAIPAAFVVEAVITGVSAADAIDISERLDGLGTAAAPLSFPAGGADLAGRVKYADPATGTPVGTTTVHIYICHR